MIFLQKLLSDDDDPTSYGNRLRARRFALFERLTQPLPRPLRIIDVGGTTAFWEQRGWAGRPDIHVTLVNLEPERQRYPNIVATVGIATDLHQFPNRSFDVAFSNSVIEHLRTLNNQMAMALEMRRLARAYWVQTPNYWFPIEPHFRAVGWQWLPQSLRVNLIQRRGFGLRGRCVELRKAQEIVDEIRLLTRRELRRLFPEAWLWAERFVGLVKSWTAISGFERQRPQ